MLYVHTQITKEPDYFQSQTVMVKLSGDGAQYTHHTSYVLLSFTILTGKPENIHKKNSMQLANIRTHIRS